MSKRAGSSRAGWVGVDFDKTLAKHRNGQKSLGKPIPKMLSRVKRWLADGKEVRIVTARASHPGMKEAIGDWTEKHVGKRLRVTNKKDHRMQVLYDDRVKEVTPNKGTVKKGGRHAAT